MRVESIVLEKDLRPLGSLSDPSGGGAASSCHAL